MQAHSIAANTAFTVAAFTGKWQEPSKYNPFVAMREAEAQGKISYRTAKAFFAASKNNQLPAWVIEIAPVRRLRSLAS